MPRRGTFVVVEGIDGSGKGTLVNVLASWARRQRRKILDLRAYAKRHGTIPEPSETIRYDVILSAEPTFSLVGRAIREEIVRENEREYPPEIVAEAFSLDRYVLYRRVVIPALRAGRTVIQERSFLSSLVYQTVQTKRLTPQALLKLPGNVLASRFPPNLVIVADVDPYVALKRLRGRREKSDESIFERLRFLRKLQQGFSSLWFRRLVAQLGSKLVYLDTDKPMAKTWREVLALWDLFRNRKL